MGHNSKKRKERKNIQNSELGREEIARMKEEVYKRPLFARAYAKIVPGDYTIKQDYFHAAMFSLFFLIVIVLITFIFAVTQINAANMRSAKLTIPSSTFAIGQESTVVDMLAGYGFVDISLNEDGNVIAYGTSEMVNAYKNSYQEKKVSTAKSLLNEDHTNIGVYKIEITGDCKILKIYTYGNLADSSTTLSTLVEDDDMNTIITTYADWCQMRNDGTTMTTELYNVLDTTDGADGTKYYSSQQITGAGMVGEMESVENNTNTNTSNNVSVNSNNTAVK